MARLPRAEVIDPNEVTIVHVINRTVRRSFLLGDDPFSGKNFDHRKVWIEEMLEHFAAYFGIDLLAYSLLSNHYHLILRTRPEMVASWDETEVARRWLMICPQRRCRGATPKPTEAELNSIRNCPVKLAEARERLSSVSWWIRLLNQRVAQRANRETDEVGRFWQDRFRSIRIEDEESLLACAAYVELNPIRAAMAETIEGSEYTSVKRRIEAELQDSELNQPVTEPVISTKVRRDSFLAKLCIDEANDPIGVVPSETGRRCSDKGFLSMDLTAYLELLDWTARQLVPGKCGSTPKDTPPILKRLGLQPTSWLELVSDFEDTFCHLAGRCDRIDAARSHQTQRRFRVPPRGRKLLPSPE
jgi:REP element-mobilizing transposase RayT